jgi:hypothetical protein
LIGLYSPLAKDLHVLQRLSPSLRIQTISNMTESLKFLKLLTDARQ